MPKLRLHIGGYTIASLEVLAFLVDQPGAVSLGLREGFFPPELANAIVNGFVCSCLFVSSV